MALRRTGHCLKRIHAVNIDVVNEDVVSAFRLELEPYPEVRHHINLIVDLFQMAGPFIGPEG